MFAEPTGVVEHLTASLKPRTAATDARVAMLRDVWVTRMVRFGSIPIVVHSIILTMELYSTVGLHWTWGWAGVSLDYLLSAVCLNVSFTKWFTRHWRSVSFTLLTLLLAGDTVIGTLGNEPMLLYIASTLLMLGSGALLPWSKRDQIFFNLLCLGSWAIVVRSGPLDPVGLYHIAGLITAATLSYFTCHVRDLFVEEHEKSARLVRDSEQRFRAMFEGSRDAIIVARCSDWKITEANEQFLKQTCVTREQVIGRTPDELGLWAVPEEKPTFVNAIREHGYIDGYEMSKRLADGRVIPVLISGVVLKLSGEDCYFGMSRDISALRAAEQQIRESEATLRKIFDASLDWMSITDMTTAEYLDVNESFVRAIGYSRKEIIGSNFFKLGVWPDQTEWQQFNEELVISGWVQNARATLRIKDGTLVPCLISAVVRELWGKRCCISSVRDITELNQAQEKTRRSEETFRSIFDTNRDAVSITDAATGQFIDVNPEFLRASGYSREEIIGKSAQELGCWVRPEQRDAFRRTLQQNGEVRNMPCEFRTKAGPSRSCLVSGVLAKIDGRLCALSMTRDITELTEAEEKMRKSEAMLRAIFDNSVDSIVLTDAMTLTIIEVNAEFSRSIGFSREEMIGKRIDQLLPPADPARQAELVRLLMRGQRVRDFEIKFSDRFGRVFPALVSAATIMIDGRPCTLSITHDISEITAAEEKVRKSEAILRAIFDNSLDNVVLFDLTDQSIIEVNKEFTKSVGYSREEVIGKRMDDLVPRGDPVRQGEFFALLMKGREVRNWEMYVSSRGGQRTFPALVSACIVEIDGRPCALSAARDISDLVKAREAALAASRAKSEFLSIMSHEIRTPMNAILGMADLMGESELNFEQRRYLDTILSNGNALLELINSILDLAKVESGRLSLEMVEFDLVELTEHAADTLAVRAHEKGVELAVQFAPDLPAILTGDPHRLRQILNNLIGNAIKFTKQGEVVVTVGRNLDPEVPGNLLFEVHDTGIGIPADKIDNIFSIFTQADTSTTRKFGGSGLGLAIVERLVGLMGGEVWVESEVGKGSSFLFTVNLHSAGESSAQAQLPIELRLRGIRTLLLIEHATTRSIVAEALRAQGAEVTEAVSEADALLALAPADSAPNHFELLVVDGELKSSDSFDALRRLCQFEPTAVAVMLTNCNGLAAKLRRMREHGIHYYCTEPVKRQELYGVIGEALASATEPLALPDAPQEAAPLADAPPAPAPARRLKILLADDSPDNRLLIRAYTKKTPYQLIEAENGQIAVDRFMDGGYDLVLMDIQMPVLDGYSAVRAIRKWEREQGAGHTPIIALTASALEEDVRRAKEAGCDVHVSKPVKKSTLLHSIEHAVEAARGSVENPDQKESSPSAAIIAGMDGANQSAALNFHI